MMETMGDPYDLLFGDGQMSFTSDSLLFGNEVMFSNFNSNSSSTSPIPNTIDQTEIDFDPTTFNPADFDSKDFEKLVSELFSMDPMTREQSIDLSCAPLESESNKRDFGTDPMESVPTTRPLIIKTPNMNHVSNTPIFVIRTANNITTTTTTDNALPITTVSTDCYNLQIDTSLFPTMDCQMEETPPLTPSTSPDESPDDGNSNSPVDYQESNYSKLLTNFDNLPSTGPLKLTNEEIKLIKQEGYQVPTKLPLNKTEEKMIKKIRRKIKNKISAQESRRKKKEYVEDLEKQMREIADENRLLKERMATVEKNHKSLQKERDLLRSMIGKAAPGSSKVLMVFAVFFAVLFGVWSPITNKAAVDDKFLSLENALTPSNNHQSAYISEKSLYEQQETTHSNHHKSRVLLSAEEYDTHYHHHHDSYLPSNYQYKSVFQQDRTAPGYTHSDSVEKYMNKKVKSKELDKTTDLKRQLTNDLMEQPSYKKSRSNYHINENIVAMDETNEGIDNVLNENKTMKIIRVERTTPAIVNDTLKLSYRKANE
ncbi:unnamed protein product [Adineta steineri]|uniref:BZIP domain-containing protein n=1 Tax=Adineta steineri TaxID=433720 RepID=A0A814KTF1_9BILA|nr:unnamed protein product [Adineta steineri]